MRALAKHTKVAPIQREETLQQYIDSVKSNIQFINIQFYKKIIVSNDC